MSPSDLIAREFAPSVVFLNSATYGLEPAAARAAMAAYDEQRAGGTLEPASVDGVIDECRELIGRLFGRTADEVAISASASQFVGTIAASLAPGSRVLLADEDFTSVLFPFLSRDDLIVETVPMVELAASVTGATDLIAVSAVQSADGRIADLDALADAAERHGARLMLDVTQAAGWLPLADVRADFVLGGGYKWLLAPRGTAYLTGRPEALATLRPTAANWYAGDDRWSAIYSPPLRLADTARRLDLSPAWGCWVGMESASRNGGL
ncbi:MAG: aminotransferase class V-fold PLP-dependent enzyme [Myxococcales bacterium]|nr:MAG: aminotransferase class V-fold PLP-dependent enzyme [Myxococcales bacterium]